MFCTSLRARKQWVSAVPHLLQHDKLKFRESKLDTHDLNLPLPSSEPGQRYLRFALLCSTDGDSSYKSQRVERLFHQSGGSDAAVVWLLGEGGDTASFMHFQIELMDKYSIPVVPLQRAEELPATLLKFHQSFLQADASSRQRQAQAHPNVLGTVTTQTLLPYCAISPPLANHSVNLLSDLTVSLANLAHKASSEAGRAEILDYFGQEEAERIILFWTQEYVL